MSISRKENGSLVKKAGRALVDLALSLTSNNAVANSAVTEKLQASDGLTFDFSKSGNKYGFKDSSGNFVPFKQVQASKAVTASTSAKTVTPDSGYHGIASVTVNPTPSQSKSITATASAQTVSPDSGKLLSSVTVNPQVHSGTRATVTANGTIDLGNTHNIRKVPVSVPTYAIRRYTFNVNGTSCTISGNGQTQSVSLNSQETIGIDGLVSCFAWSNGYFRLGAHGLCYHDGVLKAYAGVFKDVENYHTYSCTIDYLIKA